jgi:hypothetical protein
MIYPRVIRRHNISRILEDDLMKAPERLSNPIEYLAAAIIDMNKFSNHKSPKSIWYYIDCRIVCLFLHRHLTNPFDCADSARLLVNRSFSPLYFRLGFMFIRQLQNLGIENSHRNRIRIYQKSQLLV